MPTQINQQPIHLATAVNSQRAVAGKVTKVTSSWVACTNCSLGRITRACHLRADGTHISRRPFILGGVMWRLKNSLKMPEQGF